MNKSTTPAGKLTM